MPIIDDIHQLPPHLWFFNQWSRKSWIFTMILPQNFLFTAPELCMNSGLCSSGLGRLSLYITTVSRPHYLGYVQLRVIYFSPNFHKVYSTRVTQYRYIKRGTQPAILSMVDGTDNLPHNPFLFAQTQSPLHLHRYRTFPSHTGHLWYRPSTDVRVSPTHVSREESYQRVWPTSIFGKVHHTSIDFSRRTFRWMRKYLVYFGKMYERKY